MKSNRPFASTLESLLAIEGISMRELTRRAIRHGYKGSHSAIHRVYTGYEGAAPRPDQMEAIARALSIEPETFAEYRLWKVRCHFDPSAIGWKAAVANLDVFEREWSEPRRHPPAAHLRAPGGDEDPSESA